MLFKPTFKYNFNFWTKVPKVCQTAHEYMAVEFDENIFDEAAILFEIATCGLLVQCHIDVRRL